MPTSRKLLVEAVFMGIALRTVGRQGLQALSLIAFAAATNVAAQAPKLRTPGVDCPVVKNADGSTTLVPCNRPDFVEKAPPPVFPYPNVPPPKLPEAPPQTHGLDLTVNTDANAKAYHDWLCANDAGEFIFRTAENVEGIYEMRSRQESYKMHLEKYGLYRPGNPWPNEPFANDRYFWEDPLGLAWYPDLRPTWTATADYPRIPSGMIGYSLKGWYRFIETAIWQQELPKYEGARFFRHEPIYPAEAKVTETGMVVMPANRQVLDRKTPVSEIRSRYGYFWRGVMRSPHDRALGIAGGEIIVLDLATNEVMGYSRSWAFSRRNRARADPTEREAQSEWRRVYACPQGFHQYSHRALLRKILPGIGIDPANLPKK